MLPEFTIKEIANITNTTLSHDYFEFNNDFYQQQEGLAMVAPSSTILQFIERSNIYDILLK